MKKENVAILGASNKEDRYSYKAMKLLQAHGHHIFLVNPNYKEIEGIEVYKDLSSISEKIDTIVMYLSPNLQDESLKEEIIKISPKRVIFNPGSENRMFEISLANEDIVPDQACTLVLLNTNQF